MIVVVVRRTFRSLDEDLVPIENTETKVYEFDDADTAANWIAVNKDHSDLVTVNYGIHETRKPITV